MTVRVIDAIMGQGKTTFLFQMIKNKPDQRYFYIALNLAEVERVRRRIIEFQSQGRDANVEAEKAGVPVWELPKLKVVGEDG